MPVKRKPPAPLAVKTYADLHRSISEGLIYKAGDANGSIAILKVEPRGGLLSHVR